MGLLLGWVRLVFCTDAISPLEITSFLPVLRSPNLRPTMHEKRKFAALWQNATI